MSNRSRRSSPRYEAMTLVEVLAGLALLGTVAASLVVARGNLIAQDGRARMTLESVAAAEDLLAEWWRNPTQFPRSATGACDTDRRLLWRTSIVPNEAAAMINGQVVRLEIIDEHGTVLTTVELLLPGASDEDREEP